VKFIRYPSLSSSLKPCVLTIGNFDGIHLGHQALINRVTQIAQSLNLVSMVVSMQPLASQYFTGKDKVAILTPFKSKFQLLKSLNVDGFCVLNFNNKLSKLTAECFIQEILLDGLNAQQIVVGDDFRFGKNREGDFEFLKNYCLRHKVAVAAIDTIEINQSRVGSSAIRQMLNQGNFNQAKLCIGRRN